MDSDKPEEVTQSKKVRTSKPKVKTGCLTCKNRRVKCDETRPACIRCQKSGRACDGYAVGLKGPPRPLAPKSEPSGSMILDPLQRVSPGISRSSSISYFEDGTEEPFKFQPSLSVGAVDMAINDQPHSEYGDELADNNESQRFTPREYGKALALRVASPTENEENQINRGQPASSMLSSTGSLVVEDDPVNAFARLDEGTTDFRAPRPMEFSQLLMHEAIERLNCMPSSFASLAEARTYWEFHLRVALPWNHQPGHDALQASAFPKLHPDILQGQSQNYVPSQLDSAALARLEGERERHAASVERWATAFDNVWAYCNTAVGANELPGAAILRMQCLCGRISFAAAAASDECTYDNFIPEFIEMVWLARKVLEQSENARVGGANMSSLSIGAITSMYFIVNKCRDRWIRRQVLELYEMYPRRDGGWDSAMTAAVGRWAIAKEEAGLVDDQPVPEANRIRLVEVKMPSVGREAHVRFSVMEARDPMRRFTPPQELVTW